MRKVAIELIYRSGDQLTVIIPENLNKGELLGLANELLVQLGLPSLKMVITETAVQSALERS